MSDKNYQDMAIEENLKRIRKKIIVMSGKGGVGKSTVAVNTAYGFAIKGKKTGILDVDVHGPSIGKMTGINQNTPLEKSEDGRVMPARIVENLWALTLASFLKNEDDPVIWRGPMKMGAIKQFLGDISWPDLDYLFVDCPPGTGDEPLSTVQILGKVDGAIIVTTPQDVSMIDVSKSIKFCHALNIPILGLIENMSGFVCPHCNQPISIFEGKAGEKLSSKYNIELLGEIPLDGDIVTSSDKGRPYIYDFGKKAGAQVFEKIVGKIIESID